MKAISILIICVLLLSCKNTKQVVKSSTTEKTSAETSILVTGETKTDSKAALHIAETITEADSTVTHETVVEYSKPDSTGRQYAQKVTTKTTVTGKSKKAEKTESAKTGQLQQSNTSIAAKQNTQTTTTTEIKQKEKTKTPVPWKIIAALLAVAAIAFALFKFRAKIFRL